jgi:hypothetical protein
LQRGQVHELLAQSLSKMKGPENSRKKAQKAQKIVSQAVTRIIKTGE